MVGWLAFCLFACLYVVVVVVVFMLLCCCYLLLFVCLFVFSLFVFVVVWLLFFAYVSSSVYSLIRRAFAESAQNLTPEKCRGVMARNLARNGHPSTWWPRSFVYNEVFQSECFP